MKIKTVLASVCACAMLLGVENVFAMAKLSSFLTREQSATQHSTQTSTVSAPEIDAGAAPSSIALLVAGILIAAERRRRV
jgi:hypothetical protein